MLQDKRNDLTAERRKRLLARLVAKLCEDHPDLYYHPASEIARLIMRHINAGAGLSEDEREVLDGLRQRDIEVLLSLR